MGNKLNEDALEQLSQVAPRPSPELVAEFQTLTEPKQRKAFYEGNPLLRQLYSEVNFHVA
jgi:hypothetical protein